MQTSNPKNNWWEETQIVLKYMSANVNQKRSIISRFKNTLGTPMEKSLTYGSDRKENCFVLGLFLFFYNRTQKTTVLRKNRLYFHILFTLLWLID